MLKIKKTSTTNLNQLMILTAGLTVAKRSLSMSPGVSVTILMPSKDIQVDALITIPNFCVSAGHYNNAARCPREASHGGVCESGSMVISKTCQG